MPSRGRGTAGPARLRPLAGVLAAVLVAQSGTRISAIAVPWFVLVTTGSATKTGLAACCEMGPYVVVKVFAGPLVDRAGPRRISWAADVLSAVTVLLIPLLRAEGVLSFGALLALVGVIGTVRSPGDLAKAVMIPEAAERSRVPLERATGLEGVVERLSGTVGPAVGGALVGVVGPMAGLVVNAACFALGSLAVGAALPRGMGRPRERGRPERRGRRPERRGRPEQPGRPYGHPAPKADGDGQGGVGQGRDGYGGIGGDGVDGDGHGGIHGDGAGDTAGGYWLSLRQGLAFLRGEPLLLTVCAMIGVTNLLDAAYTAVFVPVWAKESGHGPAGSGLVLAAFSVMATAGSLVATAVAHRLPRRKVFFLGWLVTGAPRFLVLASGAPLWVVATVIGVGGLGAGFINPIIGAVMYERIPPDMTGRVLGIAHALPWAGIPLGGLLGGAAVAGVGLAPVLVTAGAVYFLTTNLTGLRPEWREMDRDRGDRGDGGDGGDRGDRGRVRARAGAEGTAGTAGAPRAAVSGEPGRQA